MYRFASKLSRPCPDNNDLVGGSTSDSRRLIDIPDWLLIVLPMTAEWDLRVFKNI